MEKTVDFEKQAIAGGAALIFDGNRSIKRLCAKAFCPVEVRYAQNAVTDTLIAAGTFTPDENGALCAEFATPLTASGLYLFAAGALEDVAVFANEGVNLENLYPKAFDIPLAENMLLDTVSVFTSRAGFSQYSLYTSMNGRDFSLVAVKDDETPCGENGDTFALGGREARVIRVFFEYHSASPEAAFEKLTFTGAPSGTAPVPCPPIEIPNFADTVYAAPVTEEETLCEVAGIVERRLGAPYASWFRFVLGEKKQYDWFSVAAKDGKVEISGGDGVSLAMGLNHYLKYCCHVHLSQVGDSVRLPKDPILPQKPIYRETKARVRYAYNFCTLSYTNAFFGEKEWRDELDFLALNGVNTVLDTTAGEEVWRRFLVALGYTNDAAKAFLPGPAHFAWFFMGNMFGLGGPLHDSWFAERTELARKNGRIMQRLSMRRVLQGYSGMVPTDIQKYDPTAEVIPQGTWCGLQRPSMLKTDSACFARYAALFYRIQREVLGDALYYATDPFHEGGITGGMSPRVIAKTVLSEMQKARRDAVWIIQSWQANPTSELLLGLGEVQGGREHALILDLYAEKSPNFSDGRADNPHHGYAPEFDGTPWVYCMLNNFGGRLGLHGHLDNMARAIPQVLNTCAHFAGIGMTCEASENNPVLYDFLFESVWQEDAHAPAVPVDLNDWVHAYAARRYGGKSAAVNRAWDILLDTVYKAQCNMQGQGAPECIADARPAFGLKTASAWGNAAIGYPAAALCDALRLFETDKETLSASAGYRYDLVSLRQQVLSNEALSLYAQLSAAFAERDAAAFDRAADAFLSLIDKMEATTGENKYYRLSRYLDMCDARAAGGDEFAKRAYRMDAKALITTLGTFVMSEEGCGHDYANRQWAGLFSEFYKKRWMRFLENCRRELSGETPTKVDPFFYEWNWVRGVAM